MGLSFYSCPQAPLPTSTCRQLKFNAQLPTPNIRSYDAWGQSEIPIFTSEFNLRLLLPKLGSRKLNLEIKIGRRLLLPAEEKTSFCNACYQDGCLRSLRLCAFSPSSHREHTRAGAMIHASYNTKPPPRDDNIRVVLHASCG